MCCANYHFSSLQPAQEHEIEHIPRSKVYTAMLHQKCIFAANTILYLGPQQHCVINSKRNSFLL